MRTYALALGSNQGHRLENLEQARREISTWGTTQWAPVYDNPPLLLPDSPAEWYQFFLNTCVLLSVEWSPEELLKKTQALEQKLGRSPHHKPWSPRPLDIDILFEVKGPALRSPNLNLPHPSWSKRNFVLSPLRHLLPKDDTEGVPLLQRARTYKPLPTLMAIVNVSPDSFSEVPKKRDDIFHELEQLFEAGAAFIDLGAESTRPGAKTLSDEEEWNRLLPYLEKIKDLKEKHPFTKVSLDTYHVATAARSLDYNVDVLNDVKGLEDPAMQELCVHFESVIFMHSLSVPAQKDLHWPPNTAPTFEIQKWLDQKLEALKDIPMEKLIWDPGLGFGKTALQSLQLIQDFSDFQKIPLRSLIGPSRKSLMNLWTEKDFSQRDAETLALCQHLNEAGADILRVHNWALHRDYFRALNASRGPLYA